MEGEELSCLLAPLNRSRFPFRASSVETRLIFLLKVSVLNGRGQATSIATRFIYAWSCSLSIAIGRVQMFKRKSVLLISGPIATGRVDWPCRSSRIKVEI